MKIVHTAAFDVSPPQSPSPTSARIEDDIDVMDDNLPEQCSAPEESSPSPSPAVHITADDLESFFGFDSSQADSAKTSTSREKSPVKLKNPSIPKKASCLVCSVYSFCGNDKFCFQKPEKKSKKPVAVDSSDSDDGTGPNPLVAQVMDDDDEENGNTSAIRPSLSGVPLTSMAPQNRLADSPDLDSFGSESIGSERVCFAFGDLFG